jgi:hypothetical protein
VVGKQKTEHCMMLITKWHEIRADFERGLYSLTQDELVRKGSAGTHKNEIFQGHCLGEGGENYLNINATNESFRQVPKLYE